jgi:hypothetical protein
MTFVVGRVRVHHEIGAEGAAGSVEPPRADVRAAARGLTPPEDDEPSPVVHRHFGVPLVVHRARLDLELGTQRIPGGIEQPSEHTTEGLPTAFARDNPVPHHHELPGRSHGDRGRPMALGRVGVDLELGTNGRTGAVEAAGEDGPRLAVVAATPPHNHEIPVRIGRDGGTSRTVNRAADRYVDCRRLGQAWGRGCAEDTPMFEPCRVPADIRVTARRPQASLP